MQKKIRIIVYMLWNNNIIGLVISSEFVRKQEFKLKKIKICVRLQDSRLLQSQPQHHMMQRRI